MDDLLHKLQLSNLKPAPTPSVVGTKLSLNDGKSLEDPFVYRSTIGALQYLTHTRPDIAYTVNTLSQFLKSPTDIHWQAVKRALRYIHGTRHYGIYFQQGSQSNISAYSDANWASNLDDRKSIAAYCVF